ncbi:unnamed protein product [Parnassius mnemosyne]|uniref:BTB domain-containing protein n=1 Tax=Parnassius mnemosyne TaxID=213953 RepID=A0AAV1L322_9NEOP
MNPTQIPIVFLKDVSHSALRDLLQFMYQGEVNVKKEELASTQSGPAKRKCVDPLEAGPSGSAKEKFVTIPDEDENNAVAPKMEPEFVNESMWDDDDEGANNDETNFGEDDSNMEMTGFDGSATGDGNMSGGGEGGAVGDAQGKPSLGTAVQLAARWKRHNTPW